MNLFLLAVLSNATVAAALAVGVGLLSLRLKRPAVLHLLWLVILVKLFMPPIFDFGLLSAPQTGLVAVEAVGLTLVSGNVLPTSPAMAWTVLLVWSFVGLWVLGSLTVLVVTLVRLRRFRLLITRADSPESRLKQRIDELAEKIGCSRRPRVVMTDAKVSPLVWSAFGQPQLVLPRALVAKLSDGQLDTILAHELAHLKRGDDRVRWLELAALIVFWWNPTTWVASRFLRDAEEACCDALVARALPARVEDYAKGLVETVRHLMVPEPSRLVAASGLGRPALIERRITSMFDNKTFLPMSLSARLLVILTAVLALGLTPMLTARDAAAPDENQTAAEEFTGDPISIHLTDADLDDVLVTFAKLTRIEILADPSIKLKVTARAKDEPWDAVLDRILTENGLVYTLDEGRLIVRAGEAYLAKKKAESLKAGTHEKYPVFRYRNDGPVTEPKRLSGPDPAYPEEARKAKEMGLVILECIIDGNGKVRDAQVLRSPREDFSRAAVAAVEQWLFEPAKLEGEPVRVSYILTVRFRLE